MKVKKQIIDDILKIFAGGSKNVKMDDKASRELVELAYRTGYETALKNYMSD